MAIATCKGCGNQIRWAALNGFSLPFEATEAGVGSYRISKHHGTDRASSHPGVGHPNVVAYRRHNCRKDRKG